MNIIQRIILAVGAAWVLWPTVLANRGDGPDVMRLIAAILGGGIFIACLTLLVSTPKKKP